MPIICKICPHACRLSPGKLGICGVRTVKNDKVVSLSYGEATALALDPIEKKPLACFHKGANILSYGSYGCNLRCPFCQNSRIACARADDPPPVNHISPHQLVDIALKYRDSKNIGIAYTYNEPLIAWEFLRDAATLARRQGLINVAVTNGFIVPDIWRQALTLLNAVNIDLKCFTEAGYIKLGAPGGLKVVQGSIEMATKANVHTEITTLVVPGLSDNEDRFKDECRWLASIDPNMPLHITRFFPCHRYSDKEPTDIALMKRFKQIADGYLNYVFVGNI